MSSQFGFQLRDAQENITLSLTDPALRVVFRRSIGATETGSAPLPGYGPHNAWVYLIPKGQPGQTGPSVWVESGRVNWGVAWYFWTGYWAPSEIIVVARK